METVLSTDLKGLKLLGRGKVRDIYDMGDKMLIVTTDRISAFDVIMPNGIPNKGKILTELSLFWFEKTKHIIKNHLITADVNEMPEECRQYADILEGRTMLVHKCKPYPVECVARGYITGSGWKDYKSTGEICGIKLPSGLQESECFPETLFTPASKAEVGEHDENISFEQMKEKVGVETAQRLKDYTIKIYETARDIALEKGIIIADTKFEFGELNGEIILIDEILTPDSSRFWSKADYAAGKPQQGMDKQYVRNYLETLDWGKTAPGPELPEDIVRGTEAIYRKIADILKS
ncbi:phosphoribosylaminoimidazolesuccinocarboxamide synthase [Seleniivibrio woodruffii]|uniref:Phosphoribosylaminoimidazole-succinocarboxamide synthase n=1 Tax=Seleniivibrio woodruffii TaxID=1078050 RepID=A0A4R1K7Q9_9BACT|nr:phosphoribosylaminoimidazolesuccinocarboxamide synthase [Seleniivibrio woodruffii]TCK59833.1 phosphoribosylaminoimidazole-succinocarboxamide synthase [Seleniivibrio woodruffii]TVZ35946.1 phosphoribosylaminoimidazole-succinocarboxamide synthase [Seleniivibrio woodruffii]